MIATPRADLSNHDLYLRVQQGEHVMERTALAGPATAQEVHQIQQGRRAKTAIKGRV